MIENFNEIVNNKSFEEVSSCLVIRRKNFLNEVIRSHNLMRLTFAHLTFLDCNFIDIDLRYTNFISCDFTNCNFKNCKIFQSDLTRVNLTENNFTDCQFDSVDMGGTVFTQCELIQPKFHKVRFLESVTLIKSKIWNLKKCIEVNTFDNVSKIVDDLKD